MDEREGWCEGSGEEEGARVRMSVYLFSLIPRLFPPLVGLQRPGN